MATATRGAGFDDWSPAKGANMDVLIIPPVAPLPVDRGYSVSMTIKSFKGRRDVEVHLFRPEWDEGEEAGLDWVKLLGGPLNAQSGSDPTGSRKVLLESFSLAERDQLVKYLCDHYSDKLEAIHSCPLDFPIPLGLTALSEITEGKSVGFIKFEKIPSYNLGFAVRGLYDLSQHQPLIDVEAEE